jgi:hypothetical protein
LERLVEPASISAPALPYHRAMIDDAEKDAPAFDPPDPDRVYRNYLETCRRLNVSRYRESARWA